MVELQVHYTAHTSDVISSIFIAALKALAVNADPRSLVIRIGIPKRLTHVDTKALAVCIALTDSTGVNIIIRVNRQMCTWMYLNLPLTGNGPTWSIASSVNGKVGVNGLSLVL